jgi:hypothetical protein
MTSKSPSDNARNVPTTSAELDFSLVLARVIGSIENDPAQLRNAVYELARIKLEREVWQRHPPMSMTEIRHLMLSLDTAINCVESVSSRHDESRALRSLDRLIESSGTRPHHSISNERNPELTFDQSALATSDTTGVSTLVPSAARVARKTLPNGFRSRSVQLLAGCVVAVLGLAVYLVLQRPFGFFSPQITPLVEANAPASQKGDSVVPSPAIRQQTPAWPIPVTYGVYAISEGQLNELESLGFRVPDPRVFMSTAIKTPSRTNLPDGRVVFIVFRRDIATSAPDRVAVRVIARIARAMTFNPTGSASVTPLDEEWTMRSTSFELRVAPMIENPEMVLFRPENPDFVFPSGRYALVLKGQAFDFTVAGPITEAAHCLERTEAANGAFYSECRNP